MQQAWHHVSNRSLPTRASFSFCCRATARHGSHHDKTLSSNRAPYTMTSARRCVTLMIYPRPAVCHTFCLFLATRANAVEWHLYRCDAQNHMYRWVSHQSGSHWTATTNWECAQSSQMQRQTWWHDGYLAAMAQQHNIIDKLHKLASSIRDSGIPFNRSQSENQQRTELPDSNYLWLETVIGSSFIALTPEDWWLACNKPAPILSKGFLKRHGLNTCHKWRKKCPGSSRVQLNELIKWQWKSSQA